MIAFIKKHWKAIIISLVVICLSCYFTYQNDYFGVITKYHQMFNQKITENDSHIKELEKQITELEKENKELQKEIDTVNTNITDKFTGIKNSVQEFNSKKNQIMNSADNTDSNIDYINECYKDW